MFCQRNNKTIVGLVEDGVIDWVQLHGQEDEGIYDELKSKVSCPVIKGVFRPDKEDVLRAGSYADYILLDQGGEAGQEESLTGL